MLHALCELAGNAEAHYVLMLHPKLMKQFLTKPLVTKRKQKEAWGSSQWVSKHSVENNTHTLATIFH